ncbi:hypothetical protein Mapa_011692 [Marchantia paleacea]|nr:hypothetical protein Mapa_011692 [Marchantia paleacea]
MGSLMAGWSTTPPCAKKVFKRTTSSLTRDEVNRYWRSKRTQSREHLEEAHRAAALARSRSFMIDANLSEEAEDYFPDMNSDGGSLSGSQPTTPTANERGDENSKNCWWRRSNFAFLNEPPLHEEKHYSYVSQYDIDVRSGVTEMENPRGETLHHTRSSLSIF